MDPIKFKEQTSVLLKPVDMTDEECSALPIYEGGGYINSCWKMSFIERIRALIYGKVWLYVRAKKTHPPIGIECRRTIFLKKKKTTARITQGDIKATLKILKEAGLTAAEAGALLKELSGQIAAPRSMKEVSASLKRCIKRMKKKNE